MPFLSEWKALIYQIPLSSDPRRSQRIILMALCAISSSMATIEIRKLDNYSSRLPELIDLSYSCCGTHVEKTSHLQVSVAGRMAINLARL